MIELKNVSKFYYSKGVIATGFTKVNLKFHIGEFVAITGESGSGKSTLLNVISGLDTYEEGEMYVEGKETSHYIEKDWEIYRRRYIGNIYQNFNLINSYTVYQNIDLILSLNGIKRKNRKQKILELLKRVDMLKYKNTKVSKLSGGQKQRVAIARALAKEVPVIIADEPTGNLDKKSAESIIELLREISKDKLIIIVTHNYEQVEPYVTRKITMHDGKVLEDKKMVPIEKKEVSLEQYHFKNINILEKIRLGVRNTFNVIPKFLLLLLVYSFVVAALMGEYSFFKEGEYEMSREGLSSIFQDKDDHRVIMKKKDGTSFNKEEIEKIKNTKNIDHIIENDVTTDRVYEFATENQETWISSLVRSIKILPKSTKIIGTWPEKENEIIIECEENNYFFVEPNDLLGKEFYRFEDMIGDINKEKKYVVTGIKYTDNVDDYMDYVKVYAYDSVLEDILIDTHQRYSKIYVDFINEQYTSNYYNMYMKLIPNKWVFEGTVFVSEDENYRCKNDNCIGNYITIDVDNLYYKEQKSFKIEKTYNKKNIAWILDFPNYNQNDFEYNYNGAIYMNPNDYMNLFDKGTFQMSIYVKDIQKIDKTVEDLKSQGYECLKVRDTLIKDQYSRFIRVIKIVITIILVAVLFFISYFIIRIILKSRNIYFSILRMLGANKKVCLDLLITELFVVSNISYFIFYLFAYAEKKGMYQLGFMDTINLYFKANDYIILYLIIVGMSLLISLRYARKLFQDSVMNTYREEI